MNLKRATMTLMAALFVVWVGHIHSAAAENVGEGAERFIVKLADDAISRLTDKTIPLDEQERRFREIVKDYIAFKTIARWVLGRHWRKADKQQQQRYLGLFEDLMVATYAHRFQNYSGETLMVTGTRVIDENQALVQTTLMRPNADKPLRVDWRVRQTQDQYRVIDIMVEGLSMAQTQRSEFASVLRSNGGDIGALMSDLEKRLESTREDRSRTAEAASKP